MSKLQSQWDRTGCGPINLLKHACPNTPDGLTAPLITSWVKGDIKTARQDHLNYVTELWSSLPDRTTVRFTKAEYQKLKHYQNLNFLPTAVLELCDDVPKGLTSRIISRWLTGNTKSAPPHLIAFILKACRKLETHPQRPVIVDDCLLSQMRAERDRTGLGIQALLRGKRSEFPKGFSGSTAISWLSGRTKIVSHDHLEYVLSLWRNTPDKGASKIVAGDGEVLLTVEIIDTMKAHKQRTGVDEKALLKGDKNKPDGLTSLTILNWLRGKYQTAPERHLEYVMEKWEELPDTLQFSVNNITRGTKQFLDDYVDIPDETLKQLHYYKSLGYLPSAALKGSDNVPKGLSAAMVGRWLSGQIKKASPQLLSFVLEACRTLETCPYRPVILDHNAVSELTKLRQMTGIGGVKLLDGASDVPEGLTANTVSAWINNHIRTARKDHLDYVLNRYRAFASRKDAAE